MRKYILILSGASLLFSCTTFTYEVKRSSTTTAVWEEDFQKKSDTISEEDLKQIKKMSFFKGGNSLVGSKENKENISHSQSALFHTASFDQDGEVRKAAVNRLTSQSALFHIASFDQNTEIRKAAVERLTKQSSLFHIATFDQDNEVRKAAVKKLTSQSSLSHVANFDKDSEVRKLAVERLK